MFIFKSDPNLLSPMTLIQFTPDLSSHCLVLINQDNPAYLFPDSLNWIGDKPKFLWGLCQFASCFFSKQSGPHVDLNLLLIHVGK